MLDRITIRNMAMVITCSHSHLVSSHQSIHQSVDRSINSNVASPSHPPLCLSMVIVSLKLSQHVSRYKQQSKSAHEMPMKSRSLSVTAMIVDRRKEMMTLIKDTLSSVL